MKLLTVGTFDIPHMGHAAFLRKCEQYADNVIVGINSDDFVLRYKGTAPLFKYNEREYLIAMLGYETIRNDSAGRELIEEVGPDIIAIGSDWARKDYYKQINVDQDFLDSYEISMLYIPYTPGISTTSLKERLRDTSPDMPGN
jgi:cytidyltransferase-like protein